MQGCNSLCVFFKDSFFSFHSFKISTQFSQAFYSHVYYRGIRLRKSNHLHRLKNPWNSWNMRNNEILRFVENKSFPQHRISDLAYFIHASFSPTISFVALPRTFEITVPICAARFFRIIIIQISLYMMCQCFPEMWWLCLNLFCNRLN